MRGTNMASAQADVFTDVKNSDYIGSLIFWRRSRFQAFILQFFVSHRFWIIFREDP